MFSPLGTSCACLIASSSRIEEACPLSLTRARAVLPFVRRCVIAEVFLEGECLFGLEQLLAYREGKYDPAPLIAKIPYPEVRSFDCMDP